MRMQTHWHVLFIFRQENFNRSIHSQHFRLDSSGAASVAATATHSVIDGTTLSARAPGIVR